MARPLRVNIRDGWYHVMHRGIERRTIFDGRREHERFLELLGEVHERYRFRIHAYCLLGNHYHAIIQTPDANLSQGMQWLGLAYSSWYNALHDRSGPLFQGRFCSVPVEEGSWVYELSLYIHLNPVRTSEFGLDKKSKRVEALGLAKPPTRTEMSACLKRLREYPWSSYRVYGGYRSSPAWLSTEDILRRAAHKTNERQARYRADTKQILTRGMDEALLERFRDVVGVGSVSFVDRIRRLAGEGEREMERRGRLRTLVSYEDVVQVVENLRGEKQEGWLNKHGDWGKWLVLRLARQYCGLSLSELGHQIGDKDYAAVSVGLRRFDDRMESDRKLQKFYKQSKKMLNV